jgi:hypothetical protein
MFSAASFAQSYAPPPALAGVSQGAPSETTLGSIPSRMVYSAIALPAATNQRGSQTPLPTLKAPQTPVAAPSTAFVLSTLASPGGSPDFSVAFFTQLLAQSDIPTQTTLTQLFRDAVPTRPAAQPSAEVFELFAAPPKAPAPSAIAASTAPAIRANESLIGFTPFSPLFRPSLPPSARNVAEAYTRSDARMQKATPPQKTLEERAVTAAENETELL